MFGIGWTEFILVALVLLIFVGPKSMPGMLRKLGRIINDLRTASRELRNQIEVEAWDLESPSKTIRDIGRDLVRDIPSPYDEISKAEEKLKQEFKGVVDSVQEDEPEQSDNTSKTVSIAAGKDTSESSTDEDAS